MPNGGAGTVCPSSTSSAGADNGDSQQVPHDSHRNSIMLMLLSVLVEPIRYDFVAPATVGSTLSIIRYTDGQAPRTHSQSRSAESGDLKPCRPKKRYGNDK